MPLNRASVSSKKLRSRLLAFKRRRYSRHSLATAGFLVSVLLLLHGSRLIIND